MSTPHTDRLLTEYSNRWKSIEFPLEEEFLGRADASERSNLLREMLHIRRIELAKRRSLPSRAEYQALYPNDVAIVDEALAPEFRTTVANTGDGQRSIESTMDVSMETVSFSDAGGNVDEKLTPLSGPRFRIIRKHARGGLGQVSLARDRELDRDVALKEIQAQFADDIRSQQRFVTEARVTGQLEHPGIVPVYGFGVHSNGHPYYAMRFIEGESLKQAIDRFHNSDSSLDIGSLEFRQLLNRFVDVCNAVEFAHSRDVIHRDIKPANVMLGDYGETLLVDWGLAKRLDHETLEAPHDNVESEPINQTQIGTQVGTPAYMSPEQAAGRHDKAGKASDVYSLGATLFHLMTGRPPLLAEDIKEHLERVERGESRSPRAVSPTVPKPLDSVCQKAMSSDQEGRYQSATALAQDVERWLADEPVTSYREPFAAKCWRWIRKHRVPFASGVIVVLIATLSLIILLAVVAQWNRELNRANSQLDVANTELERRNIELTSANEQVRRSEAAANEERDIALAISDFLRHDLLAKASPDEELERDITLRTVLDRASQSIKNQFEQQPVVEAAIRFTIGDAYRELAEFEEAEEQFMLAHALRVKALGKNHVDTLVCMSRLAGLYYLDGRFEDAESTFVATLESMQESLGASHHSTLACMSDFANLYAELGRFDDAEQLYLDALDAMTRKLGADHQATLTTSGNLASLYARLGMHAESERLFEETMERELKTLGPLHPDTLRSMNNLAQLYNRMGRFEEAAQMFQEAVKGMRQVLGDEHPDTLSCMNNLAVAYDDLARFQEAEELYLRVLETRIRILGAEHPDTLITKNNLASTYNQQAKFQMAEPLFREVLESRRNRLGVTHPRTLTSIANLAVVYENLGALDSAEAYYEELIQRSREILGDQHPETLGRMNNLATLYVSQQRFDEAAAILEETLSQMKQVLGEDHPNTIVIMNNLAKAYFLNRRFEEAGPLYHQAHSSIRNLLGDEHPTTLLIKNSLARLYDAQHRFDEAEPLYREIVASWRVRNGDLHEKTATALTRLGQNLLAQRMNQESELALRESLEISSQLVSDNWDASLATSLLGESLYRQERFEEAESLVLEAFVGLRDDAQSIPLEERNTIIVASGYRIVELYKRWNKPDEAAKWRAEMVALKRELGIVERPEAEVRPPGPPQ